MSVGRDYKSNKKRAERRGIRRLGLVVLILSLVGLGAGGWHYWRQGNLQGPLAAAVPAQPPKPEPQQAPARLETVAPPKYSFYEELRQREVVIDPTAQPIPRTKPSSPAGPIAPTSARYLVQAGAFRTPEEADQRKAMLALLGIRSRIEPTANGLHRVRIGPLGDLDQVQSLRQRLEANDIASFAVKTD